MAEKFTLFQTEEAVLRRAADVVEQLETQDTPILQEYARLINDYKKLLKHTKFLVKMSDLQQSQLNTRTAGLQSSNLELQQKAQEAEEAVRATEKRLAQFLEAVPVGVFVVEANGSPYYANQKAQQILGQGIIPSSNSAVLPEIYQVYVAGTTQLYPSERQPIVQALQGKLASTDDAEIHQHDKIIPIEVWGTPIFDAEGNVAYAIAVFQDITERKLAEAERIRFTRELAQLNKAYERFVPRQFLSLLNKKSIVEVQLGDQIEKEMTILFSDIREFTRISETMRPLEIFDFINNYLGQMEPIILDHHGVIDKYIGDAIMAVFPTSANDAVGGAIAMLKTLNQYNQLLKRATLPQIFIGIGLNTGSMAVGTVGGQNRMDGTVLSDAVNLASRLEGLTKTYSASLLITEHTHLKLINPLQYHIRVIDVVKVKGKTEEVTIYEVYDADPPEMTALKDETCEDFEIGFVLYHSGEFADAQPLFEKVLQINENDKAAQIYLNRCREVLGMTTPLAAKILVVDDTAMNVKILSNILKANKFEVLVAQNGESALTTAESQEPLLILLDIMMPGMDGFETCRRLKAQPRTKDIPVIFITALTEKEYIIKGFDVGAVDYITKPFQREEVLARVRVHLSNRFLIKQLIEKIN
jgi:class 3 adenylate cyclase/ActR/RegA family two-component response regulator